MGRQVDEPICPTCKIDLRFMEKDSSFGRVIREWVCDGCKEFFWTDDGVALWKVLHDEACKDKPDQ